MKKFIFPRKLNKVAIIVFVLGIGAGVFVMAQWRTKPLRVSNPVVPYVALKDTRDELTVQQESLKKQISALQLSIKADQDNLKNQSQSKANVEELEKYKEASGLSEIKGDGVIITMDDSHSNPASVDSITHAADLRDLVNFLWGVGAKAIAINGERVVFNTSIDCIVNTILINSTKTTAPFNVSAIGDGNKILDELNKEDSLVDIKNRVKDEGLVFELSASKDVYVPIFDGSFSIKYSNIIN